MSFLEVEKYCLDIVKFLDQAAKSMCSVARVKIAGVGPDKGDIDDLELMVVISNIE